MITFIIFQNTAFECIIGSIDQKLSKFLLSSTDPLKDDILKKDLLPRIDIYQIKSGYGHANCLNPLSATLLLRYLDVWDIGNDQLIS